MTVQEAFLWARSHPITLSPVHLRRLLSSVTGEPPEFLFTHPFHRVSAHEMDLFKERVQQLSKGTPLSRLLGEREFWSLPFLLNEDTLDPRADSECLIEAVLEHKPDRQSPLRILDLGTGTGCLLIAILSEYPHAEGIGIDISAGALEMAHMNAQKNLKSDRAQFSLSRWFEKVQGTFDIIISNPPYISTEEYEALDANVRLHDPKKALVAGKDGLSCYRDIVAKAKKFLKEEGLLILEIGIHQGTLVSDILNSHSFTVNSIKKDLSGIERCLVSSYDGGKL